MPAIVQPGDIPEAVEGHPITVEYHNSLRDAVLALANQIAAQPSQSVVVTVTPAFVLNKAGPAWTFGDGVAQPPLPAQGQLYGADGILPLQLPDGLALQSLTAIGRRNGNVQLFEVDLYRQPLQAPVPTQLITLSLENAADPFSVSSAINLADPGSGGIESYKRIDNTNFKYFITATLSGGVTTGKFIIAAFQVQLTT